jgi:hypothetical protein
LSGGSISKRASPAPGVRRLRVDHDIDEEIGARRVDARETHPHARADGFHPRARQIPPAQHDAHGVQSAARPPRRRLDLRHFRRTLPEGERGGGQRQGDEDEEAEEFVAVSVHVYEGSSGL